MKKRGKIGLIIILAVNATVAGWYYLNIQLAVSNSKFGIYLLKNDEQVISDEDTVWYCRNSYEIELTGEGARMIQALKVSVYGEPFVIKGDL